MGSFAAMGDAQEFELRRYLECQRDLAAKLIEGNSLERIAPDFLSTVAGLLRWQAGALWEVRTGHPELRFVSGWRAPDLAAEPLWQRGRQLYFQRGHGLPGRAWQRGEIILAPDLESDLELGGPEAVAAGLHAALAIPIPVGPSAEVLAVAEFQSHELGLQSSELIDLLAGFADQLAAFIERAEAERVQSRLAAVVEGTQDAMLSKDLDGIVTSWNPAAERLYGYSTEEAVGRHISFIVPPNHRNEDQLILERVRRGERMETYETERVRKDGTRVDVSLTISPVIDPALGVVGASVVARDITAEKRRRRAQDFLVAATRTLDRSLDPVETARTIVSTAVPELAEICLIDLVRGDGTLGDSIVAGVDPEAARRLERIRREAPLDPDGQHPVAQVLRERRPMVWRDLKAPEVVEQVIQSERHRQLIEDAGYNSAAVVGLFARGRTLGALSFLHVSRDLRYDEEDLEFLAELGDRAAMALDNALLYRERDQIAVDLQRGLRPPRPAEVEGLEIALAFEAAGERVEIGGDVYDVLPTDDGCWLLIADVAGKGSAAAGVAVAVRHAVRGLTRVIDDPCQVLGRVNELLLEGTTLNDFATAVLARLRRGPEGWDVTLASAGHPPAVHVGDGEARKLGGGAVLGGWADPEIESHTVTVAPGETLVLCTDGWLEAGPAESHRRPDDLAELAVSLADLEPFELSERLRLDAIARGEGVLRDDLVILAVRPTGGSNGVPGLQRAGNPAHRVGRNPVGSES
jgi:PAS domain S-box-containing protein